MTETERPTEAGTAPTAWDSVVPRSGEEPPTDRRTAGPGSGPPVPVEELPYELVGRPEPPPVPNGWYAIAPSADVGPGQVLSIVAVERELVVFRTAAGEVSVVDAYCPHLGAHLGGGTVEDGSLRCPYHGWRFDTTGRCVEIPYAEGRIPERACVPSYPVLEQDGMVLFWFHAGGAAPEYEVPLVDERGASGWSEAIEFRSELVASLQDMAENNVDYTHFRFVHGRATLDASTSQFTTDGPFSTVVERFDDDGLTFTRYTWGPGLALLRVPGFMTVHTATTPIDRRHVRLLWNFYLPDATVAVADEIIDGVTGAHGLLADVPIWRDKIFRSRPLLVKGDGPVTEFRRWYEQFYAGR